jgi:undecaprenyl-diphosphatase
MKNLGKIIIYFVVLAILSFIFLLFKTQALALDNSLFHMISGLSNPVLDFILIPATYFGSIILWIFLILLLWTKKDKKLSIYLFYALIVNSFLSLFLKWIFMRPRPLENFLRENFLVERDTGYSFPSGHAINASSGTAILSYFYKGKIRFLFYGLAILTAISRVYIGVHYPLDVLFGSVIGLIIGNIVLNLPTYEIQEEIEKIIYGVRAFFQRIL